MLATIAQLHGRSLQVPSSPQTYEDVDIQTPPCPVTWQIGSRARQLSSSARGSGAVLSAVSISQYNTYKCAWYQLNTIAQNGTHSRKS